MLLDHVISTRLRQRTNTTGNFRCSLSKYLYFFCELRCIAVKCGLGTQNLALYNGVRYVRVITYTNYCNFAGPKKIVRYNGDFVLSRFVILLCISKLLEQKEWVNFYMFLTAAGIPFNLSPIEKKLFCSI